MTDKSKPSPQLPKLPTSAIEADHSLQAQSQSWFEYPVKAQPHHTDYAGIVWHGTYLAWMEEARVEYLRSIGIEFADLVALGCDLPVVELSIRYHLPVRLGVSAIVKTRLVETKGVRINWDYEIRSYDGQELFMTGKVVLVGVDREKGKIMRKLPPVVQNALVKHITI
ncbi:acyl-CoA thioesterase [Waterburya agarophytonicola K14]|uniref:Acyl-CoA thioesterase n=1 Tax=Waterburya agarophytonicola KI4 TaxID=2874699 RepID=A0A964FFY1_9CYAN|nr:thioesterase family protein [Waterburya agarophytonicola]MCC0178360.1 acyl-CoA thioesterase [Waterburya agarophytonicola KI4]